MVGSGLGGEDEHNQEEEIDRNLERDTTEGYGMGTEFKHHYRDGINWVRDTLIR